MKYKIKTIDCGMDSRLHTTWEIWYYPKPEWELRKDSEPVETFDTLEDALIMLLNLNGVDHRICEQGVASHWAKFKYVLEKEES